MNDDHTPKQISHYTVNRLIGRGGMGNVYLGNDTRLERNVAIKCIRRDVTDANLAERLRREAALLAKLNHPHIVQIYDIIDEPDQLALVMEYIEGSTLNKIARESITTYSQKLLWLAEIAEGLTAAHDEGIVHRDLKAENILLNRKGAIKIMDFGIAKSSKESLTQHGKIVGSYYSISPEQAMGLPLDFRSDLFSLGILAYQLLLGKHPFGDEDNELVIAQRIINKPFTPLKKFNSKLPKECLALIEQLLAKKASGRPNSTSNVGKQFRYFAEEMSASSDNNTNVNTTIFLGDKSSLFNKKDTVITYMRDAVTQYVDNVQKPSVLVTILLFAGLAVGAYLWPTLTKAKSQYIAVLPPKITADESVSVENQKLIASTVYDALQQGIINMEGLELIPKEELEETDGTPENIGPALGANEIIRSTLECSANRCDMILARLGGERWAVQQQKSFPILTDYLIDTHAASQKQLTVLFPNSKNTNDNETSGSISDADYREYIELNQASSQTGSNLIPVLEKLDQLQDRNTKYQPIYLLYRIIAIHLYTETRDVRYLDKLEQVLHIAENLFPVSITQAENKFLLSIEQKNYSKAEQALRKIEEFGADQALVISHKAMLLYRQGKHLEANALYLKAIKLRPSRTLYYGLAFTYWKSGNIHEAKAALEKLFAFTPNDYRGNRLLATISLSEGNLTQAITAYKKLLIRKPESVNYNNLGLAYVLNRDYESAYIQYQNALEDSPDNPYYLINLADVELLRGKSLESHELYKKILKIISQQNDLDSALIRSQAYAQLNQFEQAIQALQQTQKLAPDSTEVLYNAALIYTITGETISALVYTQQALENGIGAIWFRFPWFDPLCQQIRFSELVRNAGDASRCQHE